MLQQSLSADELRCYVIRQLEHFFPDILNVYDRSLLSDAFSRTLTRVEHCFKHVRIPSYTREGKVFFSHLHADQYTVFLWFLSNEVWQTTDDRALADKLFFLNKILNGFMCMYDAGLPDVFLVLHGSGTVLGKAVYGNYFICHHNCTVGAVHGIYPTLGQGVSIAPQAVVVGSCHVGDFSTIGTGTLLRNRDLQPHALFYRDADSGRSMVKNTEIAWSQRYFSIQEM